MNQHRTHYSTQTRKYRPIDCLVVIYTDMGSLQTYTAVPHGRSSCAPIQYKDAVLPV